MAAGPVAAVLRIMIPGEAPPLGANASEAG